MTFIVQEGELNLIDRDHGIVFSRVKRERFGREHYEICPIGQPCEFKFFSEENEPRAGELEDLRRTGVYRYTNKTIILPDLKAFRVANWVFGREDFERLLIDGVTEISIGYGSQRKLLIKIILNVEYLSLSEFQKIACRGN